MKILNLPIVIRWDKFVPESSFFIPCIDRKEMERWVRSEARRLKIEVVCKQVVERGMYGLRVWRVAPRMLSHSVSPVREP
jgi:hypothetical protein